MTQASRAFLCFQGGFPICRGDPMPKEDFKRKLTAIFSADVVGYSRLMGEDEAANFDNSAVLHMHQDAAYAVAHPASRLDYPFTPTLHDSSPPSSPILRPSLINSLSGVRTEEQLLPLSPRKCQPQHDRHHFVLTHNLNSFTLPLRKNNFLALTLAKHI